jgi:hypothetical protein
MLTFAIFILIFDLLIGTSNPSHRSSQSNFSSQPNTLPSPPRWVPLDRSATWQLSAYVFFRSSPVLFSTDSALQASGRLGPHILRAVQADPSFKVTVITRENSTATFPEGTTVVQVGDEYPAEQMEKTFRGQDAVVLSLSYAGEHHRSAITKAAIAAGVRRLVASGYGANDENEEVQRVFAISANKAAMVQELRGLEQPGWSWTSVCCGLFFDLYVLSSPILSCVSPSLRTIHWIGLN